MDFRLRKVDPRGLRQARRGLRHPKAADRANTIHALSGSDAIDWIRYRVRGFGFVNQVTVRLTHTKGSLTETTKTLPASLSFAELM